MMFSSRGSKALTACFNAGMASGYGGKQIHTVVPFSRRKFEGVSVSLVSMRCWGARRARLNAKDDHMTVARSM